MGDGLQHKGERIAAFSQMSETERRFLQNLLAARRPVKILEVGVAAGGGSALILDAISARPEARLYSVDVLRHWYRDADRKAGFVAAEMFPGAAGPGGQWRLFTGRDVAFFIEEIGAGIDFCVIDTAHVHPVESLNFLTVLPYLDNGATVVVHDIAMSIAKPHSMACNVLFATAVGEKQTPAGENALPNIGAFTVTADTRKYIGNVLQGLSLPWAAKIPPATMAGIGEIISRHYSPDECDRFKRIVACERKLRNPALPGLARTIAYKAEPYPRLHALARKVWRLVKHGRHG